MTTIPTGRNIVRRGSYAAACLLWLIACGPEPRLPEAPSEEGAVVAAPDVPGRSEEFQQMELPPGQLLRVRPVGTAYDSVSAPVHRSVCLHCHAVSQTSFAAEAWNESAHAQAGLSCGVCHGRTKVPSCRGRRRKRAERATPLNTNRSRDSAHGPEKAPGMLCGSCHDIHATNRNLAARVETCMGCHLESQHVQGYPASRMGAVFMREGYTADGDLRAPDCVYCHMPVLAPDEATSLYRQDRVTLHDPTLSVQKHATDTDRLSESAITFLTPLCAKCHSDRNVQFRLENLGHALADVDPDRNDLGRSQAADSPGRGDPVMDRRTFLCSCGYAAAALASSRLPALGQEPVSPEAWSRTVCDLCGLGEPVFLAQAGGRLTGVMGIAESPVGFGRLCPRAHALWTSASERRSLQPMLRRDPATKGTAAGLEPVSWEEALAHAGRELSRVRDRLGDDGVAFAAADGDTNEALFLLSRIARTVFRTDHLDTPARLDALHAYDACRDVFGVPGNPGSLEDVDAADLLVLVGGEIADSHPSLFYRILDARRAGRTRIVLIDSRKTLAAGVADLHVRPLPGHEVSVLNALATHLFASGVGGHLGSDPFLDADENTHAWREWLAGRREAEAPRVRAALSDRGPATARRYDARVEVEVGGVDRSDIDALIGLWENAHAITTVVGPVVLGAPAGHHTVRAAAQLHRASGQWGTAGRSLLVLPKGANAGGVIAAGAAPGRLPGGRSLNHAADRDQVAQLWNADLESLPRRAGVPLLEWPAAILEDRIGAIVALRTNPAADLPASARWREALRRSFFILGTTHAGLESEAFADLILPLALVAGESEGRLISIDRRHQLIERGVDPPGEARTTSEVLLAIARTQIDEAEYARSLGGFESDPLSMLDEERRLLEGTPFDSSGITYARLRSELGIRWPSLVVEDPGIDRFGPSTSTAARTSASGGALDPPVVLEALPFVPTPAPLGYASAERPFLLVGGPVLEHFRSRVRTGLTPQLHYEAPVPRVEMNPLDAVPLGIRDGDWITLDSATGELTARVWLADRSRRGTLFIAEHFGFSSDLQGGSDTVNEPEGLFYLVASDDVRVDGGGPAGLIAPVAVRPARRREMRQRGLDKS